MRKFLLMLLSFGVLAGAGFAFSSKVGAQSSIDNNPDCDTVAIIRCGEFKASDLPADAKKGDVQKVYSAFGISASDLKGDYVTGVVWKNGNVNLGSDGKGALVATDAITAGRWNSPKSGMTKISGTDRAYKMPTKYFSTDGQTAHIKMINGKFAFAIIKSCGNPVTAKPVVAEVICKSLKVNALASGKEFNVNIDASLKNATLKYVTYTIKNDKGQTVSATATNLNDFKYPQATPGTYTISAVITATVFGKTVTTPVGNCHASFTVKENASYVCNSLTAKASDRTNFVFTPSVTLKNATLKNIVYTVKNASGTVVKTITSTNAGPVNYTNATEGKYSVNAVVTVTVNGQDKVATGNCAANFEVTAAPSYVCNSLTAQQSGDRTHFVFTPSITLKGATLKNIVYTVKDENGATVKTYTATNLTPVSHTETKVGKYTVKAVVTVTVEGHDAIATGDCAAAFEIKEIPVTPLYECTNLKAINTDGQKLSYAFTLTYVAEGGATLTKVGVDYGDTTGSHDIALSQLPTFTYTYAKAGTYNATASLTFTVNNTTTSTKTITCSAPVTITEEMCKVPGKETFPVDSPQCKEDEKCAVPGHETLPANSPLCKEDEKKCTVPGKETLPANSPDCYTPCVYNKNIPSTHADCKPPTTLVNTGPGNVIGMFAATSIAGAVAHRLVWARRYGR